jgi:uncharacterized membrane protein YdjX (TVP38/TMEM64 family)
MKYLTLVGGVCLLLLLIFFAASAADVQYLEGTGWMASYAAPMAAALGNLLLVADVLLPVPSSLLMIANGALLGPVWGSVATLISATLGGLVAFWIGRKGSRAVSRFVGRDELSRADRFFHRWGGAAIVLSRPVPIVAEAVGALAGTTTITWTRYALALVLGNLPVAVLYAWAGSSVNQVRNGMLIFAALIGIASLWLLVGRIRSATRAGGEGTSLS